MFKTKLETKELTRLLSTKELIKLVEIELKYSVYPPELAIIKANLEAKKILGGKIFKLGSVWWKLKLF